MPANPPITVAIGQFEDLVGRGLSGVVAGDANLQIVADRVEPDRLDVILRGHAPRVAIMDGDALPNLAEIAHLSRKHPDTRLVLLVARPTLAECSQALAFGASAYLGRATQARDILTAIHLASRGLQMFPGNADEPRPRVPLRSQLLTHRETEVLPLLQQGRSNAQIAAVLCVSLETVRTHARNIYRKLGVSSRRELAALPAGALEGKREEANNDAGPRRVTRPRSRHRRTGSLHP